MGTKNIKFRHDGKKKKKEKKLLDMGKDRLTSSIRLQAQQQRLFFQKGQLRNHRLKIHTPELLAKDRKKQNREETDLYSNPEEGIKTQEKNFVAASGTSSICALG